METVKYILIAISITMSVGLGAQDIHFSQYNALPSFLNPALTGFIPGENGLRLSGIYRNQWSSFLGRASFNSYGAAFDMRNCLPKIKEQIYKGRNQKYNVPTWGLGLGVIRDATGVKTAGGASGPEPRLTRNHINLSTSGIIPANKYLYLMLGLRFGAVLSRIQTENLRYDEQFDGAGGFDKFVTGEFDHLDVLNSQNVNLGGGAAMYYLHPKVSFGLGAAVDHIFLPIKYNFVEADLPTLSRRFTAHARFFNLFADFGESSSIGFGLSSAIMYQNPYLQSLYKFHVLLRFDSDFNATVNVGFRNSKSYTTPDHVDALVSGLTVNFPKVTAGVTVDVNISDLRKVSSGYGAMELFVNYRWKKSNSDCAPSNEGCEIFL